MKKFYYLDEKDHQVLMEKPKNIWSNYTHEDLKPIELDDEMKVIEVSNLVFYDVFNLYIVLKVGKTDFIHRDRAYQNGDGFHFVLGKPKKNREKTDEFYVIGISPFASDWSHHFVWYKNIDLVMTELKDTEVIIKKDEQNIFIITKIPFREIPPLHGLLCHSYGYNISYVQAVTGGRNVYYLKEDESIQSEQSLRDYLVYTFDRNVEMNNFSYRVELDRTHQEKGLPFKIQLGLMAPYHDILSISVKIDHHELLTKEERLQIGYNQFQYELDTNKLKASNYIVNIEIEIDKVYEEKRGITIYQKGLFDDINKQITCLHQIEGNDFIKESIYTVQFLYENLISSFNQLRPYEDFNIIYDKIRDLQNKILLIHQHQSLFIKGEVIRLAYLSKENSLEPYSLYIPKTLHSPKLIVYLHGSGSTDESLKGHKYLIELANVLQAIVVAPYGRGTSHFYSPKESRSDVLQVTKRIKTLYNIDDENVFLSGFSMGGYGILPVYEDETSLFNGLIMISGHPSIVEDYTLENKLKIFKDVPFVIFHGTEDRNCPVDDVIGFASKLQKMSSNCLIYTKDGLGHSGLIEEWYNLLKEWFI